MGMACPRIGCVLIMWLSFADEAINHQKKKLIQMKSQTTCGPWSKS